MQRRASLWKRQGLRIGFVPTMGYLHRGHLSLVQAARQRVGPRGKVVVSIYVNPTQFAPTEDLGSYPRDLARDTKLCREAGVDLVFVPTDRQMYPAQKDEAFSTFVVEGELSQSMEGRSRPTHFRGVATVVAKLFNIVLPNVAFFGRKDFQQAAVIERMVRDLNFPVQIVKAPTVREPDGLALSSRNKHLTPDQRTQAAALWESIRLARTAVKDSKRSIPAVRLRQRIAAFITKQPAARLDYIEFFDPLTLRPAGRVRKGTQMALAVWFGKTRLIDNARL